MSTTQHPPSPACRAGTDLPTNVQDVSRAVSHVNTHRPRFQVRARPSYTLITLEDVSYPIYLSVLGLDAQVKVVRRAAEAEGAAQP